MFPKQDYFKDSKDLTVSLWYPAQGRHLINCSNYVVMSVLLTGGSSLSSPEGQETYSDSHDLRLHSFGRIQFSRWNPNWI